MHLIASATIYICHFMYNNNILYFVQRHMRKLLTISKKKEHTDMSAPY